MVTQGSRPHFSQHVATCVAYTGGEKPRELRQPPKASDWKFPCHFPFHWPEPVRGPEAESSQAKSGAKGGPW